jgi:trigger factor
LEVKVSRISDSQQEVEISLEYNEILPDIQAAYKEESKLIQIDGFRKGKAPVGMIKKLYGEAIEYKASEKIATKKFWEAVDNENIKVISTPQLTDIDFTPGQKLTFKVLFEIKPKLELKDYKNLEIEKPIFKLKEDDVQRELNYILKPFRKFEDGDSVEDTNCRLTVNLNKMDAAGELIPDSRSENMQIDLSDEKVNPNIFANAKGKKAGESFKFSFVDEHYHGEELHREEYNYLVEIVKIEKFVTGDMTEEQVKKISGNKAGSIEEFQVQLKQNFEDYYKKQSEEIFVNNLLNEIVKNNDFTPPAGYVETVHKRLIDLEIENAKRYKVKDFDEAAVTEYLKPRAEWNAKWQIILENMAEAEGIVVDESEFEKLAQEESEKTGISVPKLIKFYKDSGRGDVLLEEKIITFLKENNKIKEVDADEKTKEIKGKE